MQEKTFKIKWNDELGRDWMNIYNLELCLFSQQCVGGRAKELVEVVERTNCNSLDKLVKVCETCDQRFKCWTEL